ncbi:MAG: aspartate-semialdehyde dehydrogenase [Clostridia bacterium]|nr:aspartate-semialdehyde dehydrogenase [Clostridia bacterium]
MKKYRVGIMGCTESDGQRLAVLLEGHPWFETRVLAAQPAEAGKTYREAAEKWSQPRDIPARLREMRVTDGEAEAVRIADECDFVISAVAAPKTQARTWDERMARLESPVISLGRAHMSRADVPLIIPEINPQHAELIPAQRRRLGTERGFIAAVPSCCAQSCMPALQPLREVGIRRLAVTALLPQALLRDDIVPCGSGEEEGGEREMLKIWGSLDGGAVIPASAPEISVRCVHAPLSEACAAAVFAELGERVSAEEAARRMRDMISLPQRLRLPSAPLKPLHVFDAEARPRPQPDAHLEGGMAAAVGSLRQCGERGLSFISMINGAVRGAAGSALLLAELLCAQGYISGDKT